jgi:hypothetical protein
LVPVYTKSLSGLGGHLFNQEEEYYVFSYSLTINTKDDGTEVLVYKLNGIKDLVPEKDLVDNDLFIQKVIDFDTQEFYELKEEEEKTVYERVKSLEDIDKDNKKYFTIEATLLTGYLEKEPVEGEEETEEEIYTNFYIADTYYYKTSNNDYLLDRNSKITEGR